ncbi:histone acetyltransferase [Kappamyces sp. JEL0680]|nr:histone acetyltransferase [Kappamyces sp. JEL0680]
MVVVKHPLTVLGGITYKPFVHGQFAEIVFCAIDSTQQVQGYGSRLMSHVKDYVLTAHNCKHFLTYADNYAIGYFKKQGFTTDITLEKEKWMGYIKDYEGGTIMQCTVIDKVKYLEGVSTIAAQRWSVFKKIRDKTNSQKVYPGLKFKEGQTSINPSEIPGLKEAGWISNGGIAPHRPMARQRGPLHIFMKKLIEELKVCCRPTDRHRRAHIPGPLSSLWPVLARFLTSGVADYYDIIKNPMGNARPLMLDLRTLDENVESDKYQTADQFIDDVNLIWTNCRTYNQDGSTYVKCANRLEKWFKERLKILRIEMKV